MCSTFCKVSVQWGECNEFGVTTAVIDVFVGMFYEVITYPAL